VGSPAIAGNQHLAIQLVNRLANGTARQAQMEAIFDDHASQTRATSAPEPASNAGFSRYSFSRADFPTIRRKAGGRPRAVSELFRLIERLNGRPVSTFANIAQLYAGPDNSMAAGPRPRAVAVLRDLFLERVDRRIQKEIYRQHFVAHPPPTDASHDRKIAMLEATQTQAQAIVDSYDWHWLADWLQLGRIGEDAESCVRRLSNFAFRIHRVNFRFTYHCNIACRHCYNSSGPQLKAQRIPLDPMLALVAQMPEAGIEHLNLTGGEPFLYPGHLTSLIAAGRAAGLRGISIYTNGYWAMNAERAARALERLAAVGFMLGPDDHIKVSTGAYHQEFVTFDCVLTLARAYYALFGRRVLVDFEIAPGSGAEVTQRVRQLIDAAGLADRLELSFRTVSPLGRGQALEGIPLRSIDIPCDSINQIVFDPDGSVRPCCGLNNENHGIVIGQLQNHRLKDLIKRMQNDPILQFLARKPMSSIFEHISKPRNPAGYSGVCHLCQDALGSVSDKNPLQARLFASQRFYPFWFALPRPI
jgi:MoaA/NifB/PqqE/SkfB family radical SAM enzyme